MNINGGFRFKLVDENNFDLNYHNSNPNIYQYADRIMIYDSPLPQTNRPLCYIEYNQDKTWIRYGLDKKESIEYFINDNNKEIKELLKIIEIDRSVRTKLHKKHQNPKMTHRAV